MLVSKKITLFYETLIEKLNQMLKMPKFYLNLGYKLKKKALCYSHLNNTVDILDRNIVMDYFRHENHWQSSQKKKNNNKTIYYILLYNKILYICIREY